MDADARAKGPHAQESEEPPNLPMNAETEARGPVTWLPSPEPGRQAADEAHERWVKWLASHGIEQDSE